MTPESLPAKSLPGGLARRAMLHAALGDQVRLAIVDELVTSDRSPVELRRLTGATSNLLAHHLQVLDDAGIISRHRSSGDGRRRYVRLEQSVLDALAVGGVAPRRRVVFVCTHNSARSQLAAALWTSITHEPAASAGTRPAAGVHPGAVAAARRAGLDLDAAVPRRLDEVDLTDRLIVTVCDRAHEDLDPPLDWLHWSIADPVAKPSKSAFDRTVSELRGRIRSLAASPDATDLVQGRHHA